MKGFLRIALSLALCSFTSQASIGSRHNPIRSLFESHYPAVVSEQNLNPSAVFDKVDVVLEKIDAVANFIRDYNAIPKIGSCLKFIMPRFKVGRKFLMYYDHVRAKNEGRFPSLQKTTRSIATAPKQTHLEYIYIYPSRAALGISKAISDMKLLPGEARVPQALKRVTCYNCRTPKEQWKRYNRFQNRRKRWPKQFYNPTHIIPASNELHLFDYVTVKVTVRPTTAITIKSFRDILPGPNQLPYYANMFLDVFDTHFETWNSKIRSVIQTIKQKWRKNQGKNKNQYSGSQSSSYSSSETQSRSDSSSDYSSSSNESSRSSSNYSSSSEYYDETDESSRAVMNSNSDERMNKDIRSQNVTNKDQYEYYSDSSGDQVISNKETSQNDKNANNRKYYDSLYNINPQETARKKIINANPPVNNDPIYLSER